MARSSFAIIAGLIIAVAGGCSSPSKPNIALRRQNATLRQEVESLKLARDADAATIRGLESRATTVPFLPNDRIGKLFTAHGLRLGKLTGGWDRDRNSPGDEGLQIFVVPTDQQGDEIKAAGTFVVDAFNLARSGETRLGHWEISVDDASKKWLGNALQYGFIFELPWQTVPSGSEVTVRVTFTDELTGRTFTAQRAVKIDLPRSPATIPSVTQR
jgi:hypothetical protein